MQDEILPSVDVLKKPSAFVQIDANLNLFERRLLNTLLCHAMNEGNLYNGEECVLALKDARPTVSPGSRSYHQFRPAIERLVSTKIKWNSLEQDKSQNWGVTTFLAYGERIGSNLIFRVNSGLVKKMQDPYLFSRLRMTMQCGFTTKYALITYEFFNDVLCRQKSSNLTLDIEKELIYKLYLLETKGERNQAFSRFETNILKPAIEQVNDKSDIDIKYTVNRDPENKLKVLTLSFTVTRTGEMLTNTFHLEDFSDQSLVNNKIYQQLISFKISRAVAADIIENYDDVRITNNINYAIHQHKNKKKSNLAGYIITCIRENMVLTAHYPASKKKEKVDKEKKSDTTSTPSVTANNRDKQIIEGFSALDETTREQLFNLFVSRLKTAEQPIIKTAYRKLGIKSKTFRQRFTSLMADEIEDLLDIN